MDAYYFAIFSAGVYVPELTGSRKSLGGFWDNRSGVIVPWSVDPCMQERSILLIASKKGPEKTADGQGKNS